ncbi:hypothetical protein ACGFRB_17675 [Streptomyces sp. NPDC048718]|uniref:hypothetical protein n=1 Tax=Streptomyces sp. NPDC048718 TaxID=3365587 RepID=UPI0037106692
MTEGIGETRAATALDLPATRDALTAYRARARTWSGGGLLAFVTGVVLFGVLSGEGLAGDIPGGCVTFGGGAMVLGLAGMVAGRRMRRALAAGPWTAHSAVIVPRGMGMMKIALSDPATGEAFALVVRTVQPRLHLAQPDASGVMWWCGDPLRGGVLSQPGGGSLVWTTRIRSEGNRRRAVARAMGEGLLGRTAEGRTAEGRPQGGGLPKGEVLSQGGALSYDVSAPKARPAASRRRGAWRWVIVVGAILLGTALRFDQAAQNDPRIDVFITSMRADHSCTVTWEDPFDGESRTGPFHCSDDATPAVSVREKAYVVSYGPWKGELYPVPESGGGGPAVADYVVFMGVSGMFVLFAGLVGGTVAYVRRRRRKERLEAAYLGIPAVGPAYPVSLAAAGGKRGDGNVSGGGGGSAAEVTYARIAARAWTGKRPSPPRRPEPDIRQGVPWWRIPGLRRLSGLHSLLVSLAMTACFAVMWWVGGSSGMWVVGLFTLFGSAVNATRFVRLGLPVARILARAANAPVPVPKRYVLLGHQGGTAPVLVVFSAHGGPDDRPEGLLRLLPHNLPDAPTGTLELRGWQEVGVDGSPAVVARVDGRTLWPMEPYLEAGTPEFAAFTEQLALTIGAGSWTAPGSGPGAAAAPDAGASTAADSDVSAPTAEPGGSGESVAPPR